MPEAELGSALLHLARAAIAERLDRPAPPAASHARLQAPGASFVTLTRHGELRGCIGSLDARRPLADDVRDNAQAAAFRDPRFSPLASEEYEQVRIEVSLLTPPAPLACADEAEALEQLRPGIDGIVLRYGSHRSTFLPQVWQSLPEPLQFIRQLKRKAGLPADFWDEGLCLARYEVTKWRENP